MQALRATACQLAGGNGDVTKLKKVRRQKVMKLPALPLSYSVVKFDTGGIRTRYLDVKSV